MGTEDEASGWHLWSLCVREGLATTRLLLTVVVWRLWSPVSLITDIFLFTNYPLLAILGGPVISEPSQGWSQDGAPRVPPGGGVSRGLCPLWPALLGTTGRLTPALRSSPVTHGATGHALGAPLCPMSLPDWLRGGWDGPSVGSANSQGRRQESTVAGSRAGQCLASESHWPGADTGPAIAKKLGHSIYLPPQD